MKILVGIPCYNCQKQIVRVLSAFDQTTLNQVSEILCFDNGSQDQTPLSAQKTIEKSHLSKARVVINNDNYGLGGSQKLAFQYAREHSFDYVIILHGDNQAKTEEVIQYISEAKNDPSLDAILGSRFMPGSRRVGYSLIRVLGNNFFNLLYSLFWGKVCWDMGSGLNMFKVSAIDKESMAYFNNGFTFNMDMILFLFSKRRKIKYLPMTWTETDQVSNARNFKVGWETLKILAKWRLFPFLKKRESTPRSFTEFSSP